MDETCEKTHLTLSINPAPKPSPPSFDDIDDISKQLNIEPTSWQIAGQIPKRRRNTKRPARLTAWLLESEIKLDSQDVNDHIDWLLQILDGKEAVLKRLLASGCSARIWCYWLSAIGHGGPTLTARQMSRLATLGLDINFDVYGTI